MFAHVTCQYVCTILFTIYFYTSVYVTIRKKRLIIEKKEIWIMYVQIFKLYDGMQNVPF